MVFVWNLSPIEDTATRRWQMMEVEGWWWSTGFLYFRFLAFLGFLKDRGTVIDGDYNSNM